jgi:hypothetical protein
MRTRDRGQTLALAALRRGGWPWSAVSYKPGEIPSKMVESIVGASRVFLKKNPFRINVRLIRPN